MSKFRSKVWDPSLIASQIVTLQFQFYSTLLFINYLLNRFINAAFLSELAPYSLSQIFDYRSVNFHSTSNGFVCFAYVINSFVK